MSLRSMLDAWPYVKVLGDNIKSSPPSVWGLLSGTLRPLPGTILHSGSSEVELHSTVRNDLANDIEFGEGRQLEVVPRRVI